MPEVYTRVENGNGNLGGEAGSVERFAPVLEELGYGKKEARRRIEGAIRVLRESGQMVTDEEVLRRACSRGCDHRRSA